LLAAILFSLEYGFFTNFKIMASKGNAPPFNSDQLKGDFLEFVIKYRGFPDDLSFFCEVYNIKEADFYSVFNSLDALHSDIWKSFIIETIDVLREDPHYGSFSVREQLLAFYFTHMEILKPRREFIQVCDKLSQQLPIPSYLNAHKEQFASYSEGLINAGLKTGEVADRKMINRSYANGLWLQLIFVVKFWIKDESPEFEKTDAAIEKAVNLSAEMVRPGPIDSIIDFAKFIYQNR
tara:strand:- start:797 stop:1504 length:708 start_codon:yes stop_codon:yes gene_type:complete